MGLFDKLLGGQTSENAKLSPREAVAGILLITVAADGNVSSEEVEGVIAISNRMKLLKDQPAEEFNAMIRKLHGYIQKHGFEWLLGKASEALDQELRETVFALSADMIFADGSIEQGEKAILESIQSSLKVSDEMAIKILEVIQIKNRG